MSFMYGIQYMYKYSRKCAEKLFPNIVTEAPECTKVCSSIEARHLHSLAFVPHHSRIAWGVIPFTPISPLYPTPTPLYRNIPPIRYPTTNI